MSKSKRARRTLGVLAGTMTGTALVLGWMNPAVEPPAYSFEELTQAAMALIEQDADLDARRWHSVEIIARPTEGGFLAASVDSETPDFVVDRWGRCVRTANRNRPSMAPGQSYALRIQVALDDRGRAISARQWEGLQALVQVLGEFAGAQGRTLPIRIAPDLSVIEPHPSTVSTPLVGGDQSG